MVSKEALDKYEAGINELFRGKGYRMVADWEKAKVLIQHLLSISTRSTNPVILVEMGLKEDWWANYMTVWEDGEFTPYSKHQSSTWAEPAIQVHYADGTSEWYRVWYRKDI